VGPKLRDLGAHQERRRQLIERLRQAGVRDLAVLYAFDRVPRHWFVPDVFEARAYADEALPLGYGQTISRPSTHALFLQNLGLKGDERVLEIGTGSGFQTALLAALCRQVFSIERVPELAAAARTRIEALGFDNVAIRAGDGTYGWRRYAPYDAILVGAGAREAPQPLVQQLTTGGQLLIPLGEREAQKLHRIVRTEDGSVDDTVIADVRFVALYGLGGLNDEGESKW
jgi:protein-L-isoaspartate(D-aspartate) O-methyltransferase